MVTLGKSAVLSQRLHYPKRAWIRQAGEKAQWEGVRVLLCPRPHIKFPTLPPLQNRARATVEPFCALRNVWTIDLSRLG